MIGVLAAIVLPKFSKVMETRKTTEAEELMAAVRTEQERRCALDKPYATEFTQMRDLVASSQATKYTTKNYVYELGNTGMQALSTGNTATRCRCRLTGTGGCAVKRPSSALI